MRNPYEILGLAPGASDRQVRDVYRRLAKKYHPDLNPGNRQAEERFKQINEAYEQLSDPPRHSAGDSVGPRFRARGAPPFARSEDLGDLFKQFFNQHSNNNLRSHLTLDFLEAINGTCKQVFLANGRSLMVTVPPGAEDGQVIRVSRPADARDQKPTKAYVTLRVRPHKYFTRKGNNLYLDFPATVYEAVMGLAVSVPTPSGLVWMNLPKGSNTDSVVRLRGRGVPSPGRHGDLYVRIKIVLPRQHEAGLEKLIQSWESNYPYDPRAEINQTEARRKS